MQPDRWRRIKEILETGLRLSGNERLDYVGRACGDDAQLREEVQSLIDAYEESGDALEIAPRAPADPLIGSLLGPYRVAELIGSGGMGSVYRAERADNVYQKEVAVKV